MLSRAITAAFRPMEETFLPPILRTEHGELVCRGYQHARFLRRYEDNLSSTASVLTFQCLALVCHCVVMLHCSDSKETTNKLMRRNIVSKNDDETLARYRRGVIWG